MSCRRRGRSGSPPARCTRTRAHPAPPSSVPSTSSRVRCAIDWTVPTPVAVGRSSGEPHPPPRRRSRARRGGAWPRGGDALRPTAAASDRDDRDVRPPTDARAPRDVSDALLADPADPRTLGEWGPHRRRERGRTLARAFLGEHRVVVRALAAHSRPACKRRCHTSPTRCRSAPSPDASGTGRRAHMSRAFRATHRSHAGPLLPARLRDRKSSGPSTPASGVRRLQAPRAMRAGQ